MANAALEVEIINKVTNLGAFAEEKAAMQGLQTSNPLTTANYGGQLTKQEEAYAAAQLASITATKQGSAAFAEYETKLKNAVIVSGEAGAITDGLARKMNALGQLGLTPVSLGLIGAVIGIAGVVEAGKSWLDNSDKQEEATKSLAQAYATLGEKVPTKEIAAFIDKNAAFEGSMYDVEQGFAALARAGFNDTMQQRLMNDALDLAAAKHVTLGEAVRILTSASTGMSRGLLDLGVSQRLVNEALAKGSTDAEKYQALLALLEPRIKDAHKSTSDLHQSQSKLNIEWQKLSNDYGPALAEKLSAIDDRMAKVVHGTDEFLNRLSKSDWSGFNDVLVTMALRWADVTTQIRNASQAFDDYMGGQSSNPGASAAAAQARGVGSGSAPFRQRGFTATFGKGGQ